MSPSTYRGRFAPSPTGPLHFGSLLAAFGSWLMARQARGRWLVRIEDIDRPREVPGAADEQLHTLQRFGPVRSVPAEHVFELGFEAVNRSTRHKSGLAVRFPRILRWRHDKPASEADRIETLRALAR